jgi:hypothetical protein
VIVADALLPSTAAVIVALPGATPATSPLEETVTFAASEVVQAKLRDRVSPAALFAVAASWYVAAGTTVAASADMVTVAVVGGGGGPTTASLPPHEPISHPRAIAPADR